MDAGSMIQAWGSGPGRTPPCPSSLFRTQKQKACGREGIFS